MSRRSKIFGDPLILPNPKPLRYRSSSKDIIHSMCKDQDEKTTKAIQRAFSSNALQMYSEESSTLSPPPSPTRSPSPASRTITKVVIPEPTKPLYYIFNDKVDYIAILTLAAIITITIIACPASVVNGTDTLVTLPHVFYSGWVTAVATGVGVVPFFFLKEPSKFYTGMSNAIAAGMMIAASMSLVKEALEFTCDQRDFLDEWTIAGPEYHSMIRTAMGVLLGLVFILSTKLFLDQHEDLSIESVVGSSNSSNDSSSNSDVSKEQHQSAQKMVLIIIVMTLHSLSEGIGIGVSYGGQRGMQLGQFISLSLAVHNIPEGLAVGLVMKARNVSTLRSVLWAIFTSIPQPIFAIPAYLFIEKFAPMLPTGLGFAAGAMAYVACFELFSEAREDLQSWSLTSVITCVAFVVMMVVQGLVKEVNMTV